MILSESRVIKFAELAQNVRSLVNLASGEEFLGYTSGGGNLTRIDRFQYLAAMIQAQGDDLQAIQNKLVQERFNPAQ